MDFRERTRTQRTIERAVTRGLGDWFSELDQFDNEQIEKLKKDLETGEVAITVVASLKEEVEPEDEVVAAS